MGTLELRHTEIRAHWYATANALGGVLPESGGHYFPDTEHGRATLSSQNFPDEIAIRYGGARVPVVPLIQTTPDDPIVYWAGWHEEWATPVGGSGRRLQFVSSAITVYYGTRGAAKRQLLRCEWAGVLGVNDQKQDVFQAPGSAHPHWHVDGVRTYFDDLTRQLSDVRTPTSQDEVREFGEEMPLRALEEVFAAPFLSVPDSRELCWTNLVDSLAALGLLKMDGPVVPDLADDYGLPRTA